MSNETKRTPGPWKFDRDDVAAMQRSYRNDPKKIRIETISVYTRAPGSEGATVVGVTHNPDDGFDLLDNECAGQIAADLSLIAAAPDLLDAAERLMEHYSASLPAHLVEEFRAAIAKAEGRQS